MALNQYGVGFVMNAEDKATPIFSRIRRGLMGMGGAAKQQNMQMQSMGRAFVGFAATRLLRPFKAAMEESRAFGKAISEVSTLVDEAAFPMERMGVITQDLAATYGKDAKEQAAALYQTISSGVTDASEATDLLHVANKLAAGGVTEVAIAVDGLTTMVNAYSATQLKATDASDAFFVAIKAGKTTAEELSGAIGKVAPVAAAAKIGSDELLASIAAITTQGISTRESVSGLKAAIANILKPTSDAQKEAKKLGIQFDAAALRSKGLKGMLDSITSAEGYTEDSMTELFGSIEGLNAMLALTANGGAKLNEVMDSMKAKAGATDQAFQKMQETMDFQLGRFRELRNNIARSFGESLERILAPVVKIIVRITEGIDRFFRSLPPGAKDVIVGIVGGLSALIALAGGLMLIQAAFNMLGFSFLGMIKSFATFILVGAPVLVMLGGIATAVYALYKAFQKNTGGITDAWYLSMDKIKLAWRGVTDLLSRGDLSEGLKKELEKSGNEGVLGFLNMAKRLMERFKSFWAGLKEGFDAGVAELAESDAFRQLMDTFRGLFDMFTGEGAENSAEMLRRWGDAGEGAGRKLASLGEKAIQVINWLMKAGAKIAEAMKDLTADDIANGISAFVDSAKALYEIFSAIASVVRTIANLITIIVKSVVGVFSALGGNVTNAIQYIGAVQRGDRKGQQAAQQRIVDFQGRVFSGGEGDPFAGVREDVGDIARTWGSETRMGFEDEDAQRAREGNEEQIALLEGELSRTARERIAAIDEQIASARSRRSSTEQQLATSIKQGRSDEIPAMTEALRETVRSIETLTKQRRDLNVYLNADEMHRSLSNAGEDDAIRNLDKVEVASVV